jgi:hypothetical protein
MPLIKNSIVLPRKTKLNLLSQKRNVPIIDRRKTDRIIDCRTVSPLILPYIPITLGQKSSKVIFLIILFPGCNQCPYQGTNNGAYNRITCQRTCTASTFTKLTNQKAYTPSY